MPVEWKKNWIADRRLAVAIVALLVGLGLIGRKVLSSAGFDRPTFLANGSTGTESVLHDEPLKIRPLVKPIFSAASPEARFINSVWNKPPALPHDGAGICHLLRLYGLGPMPDPRYSSGIRAVHAMTDETAARKLFGEPLLFQTRYGVRFTIASSGLAHNSLGEAHRDQCLAAFGELGLPLSTQIRADGGSFTLRDLLNDSVATFDLNEQEITWTAIGYCLYLPPQKTWVNRDGRAFSFDDLANELMRRPLDKASCGGTHILGAMTLLLRVDSQVPVLSPAVRELVLGRLRQSVATATASQERDGSWTLDWYHRGPTRPAYLNAVSYKLLVTGHLLEWMQYLPLDIQPGSAVYVHATDWLRGAVSGAAQFRGADFCPWTHGVCALRNLIGSSSGSHSTNESPVTSILNKGGMSQPTSRKTDAFGRSPS